jgi:hypothetical protein
MAKRIIALLAISAALSGCAINQTVTPTAKFAEKEICIVQNPAVSQPGFLTTYEQLLKNRGYAVQILQPSSAVTTCKVTTTYTANWRWDLALYMAYADIRVYIDGRESGRATYDAMNGGGNLNKFIKADQKIEELVNMLFAQADRPA